MKKQEKRDMITELNMMLENDCYTLEEAIEHIATCYDVSIPDLTMIYMDVKLKEIK